MNERAQIPDDMQWHIDVVKDRYRDLTLSGEQALLIHRHDEEKNKTENGISLSVWEMWDYDDWFFRKILSPEQFTLYKKRESVDRKGYIDSFQPAGNEPDALLTTIIREKINYYSARLLPGLFKPATGWGISMGWLDEEAKISLLRREYRRFLQATKMQLLIDHFREYRTYRPQLLEQQLFQNKLLWIWPDYEQFRSRVDVAVIAICDFLERKLEHFSDSLDEAIRSQLSDLRKFHDGIQEKYFSVPVPGWHVYVKPSAGNNALSPQLGMTLLLCDPNGYGMLA